MKTRTVRDKHRRDRKNNRCGEKDGIKETCAGTSDGRACVCVWSPLPHTQEARTHADNHEHKGGTGRPRRAEGQTRQEAGNQRAYRNPELLNRILTASRRGSSDPARPKSMPRRHTECGAPTTRCGAAAQMADWCPPRSQGHVWARPWTSCVFSIQRCVISYSV